MTDLVDRLAEVAANAIRNKRPDLVDTHRIRGIVLDIEIRNGGTVVDGTAHVTRQIKTVRGEPSERGRAPAPGAPTSSAG